MIPSPRSSPSRPRRSPASTTGATRPRWPGRSIRTASRSSPKAEFAELIARERVDEVVLAYSDVPHEDVMHKASLVLAAGADFRLLGPDATMLELAEAGHRGLRRPHRLGQEPDQPARRRSPARRRPARRARPPPDALRRPRAHAGPALRHARGHRRRAPDDRGARGVRAAFDMGMVMYAGVDYGAILRQAEAEADVIVWDGGNNDFPFYRPDLQIVVADPLRPGHELALPPRRDQPAHGGRPRRQQGRHRRRRAIDRVLADVAAQPVAPTSSRGVAGVARRGRRSRAARARHRGRSHLTHGGMPFGAGSSRRGRPEPPRSSTRGRTPSARSRDVFEATRSIGAVLPAMGYSDAQLPTSRRPSTRPTCDAVVTGTPIDLGRLIDAAPSDPARPATRSRRSARPTIEDVLQPIAELTLLERDRLVETRWSARRARYPPGGWNGTRRSSRRIPAGTASVTPT